MGVALGTRVMSASFHRIRNIPDDIEQLKMLVTGSVSSGAKSFRRQAGTPSGPGALKAPRQSSFLQTVVADIVGGCSGYGKKAGSFEVSGG